MNLSTIVIPHACTYVCRPGAHDIEEADPNAFRTETDIAAFLVDNNMSYIEV